MSKGVLATTKGLSLLVLFLISCDANSTKIYNCDMPEGDTISDTWYCPSDDSGQAYEWTIDKNTSHNYATYCTDSSVNDNIYFPQSFTIKCLNVNIGAYYINANSVVTMKNKSSSKQTFYIKDVVCNGTDANNNNPGYTRIKIEGCSDDNIQSTVSSPWQAE